jgi:hypothetical protein
MSASSTAKPVPEQPSGYVELKRVGADPTQIVSDLDRHPVVTAGKFSVIDSYTRRSWPCMCEYSARDIYSQKSIPHTKAVHDNAGIGCGLKSDTNSDWRSYRSGYVWFVNPYRWCAGSSLGRSSFMRCSILALQLLSCDQWPRTRLANSKT